MSTTSRRFFDEYREQSQVKAEIVEKYFDAWAGIITATQERNPRHAKRIAYIDLFAGPGRYKDGAASTPLRVLRKALAKPVYSQRLITVFNDKDEESIRNLEEEIAKLPGIDRLKYPPRVWNEEVGSEIASQFASYRIVPTLAFVDPWGYKGLSLELVNSFLKDWGCDCIFFFNYNRINAGLSNPYVREHMAALFGEDRANRLREELAPLSPEEREATIVNNLAKALKEYGQRYVLPFCFKNESGKRSTHHMILVTKHFRGYEVMKEIMAKYSSDTPQGVPSFTYLPPTARAQTILFELNRPLEDLRKLLLSDYAGRTLSMRQVYEEHSIDKPYIAKNYKDVLWSLFEEGVIQVDRPPKQKGTFANEILVTFPR